MKSNIPLLLGTMQGHENRIRIRLDMGARLDTEDEGSNTPLVQAAKNRHDGVWSLCCLNMALLIWSAKPEIVRQHSHVLKTGDMRMWSICCLNMALSKSNVYNLTYQLYCQISTSWRT